ncbi:MAG: ABC transporter permease [Clostridia bacterium]|nr:ABC transporter permease [Clostridia bacterium]
MIAIFKREFKSYFNTPIGYIVLAAFYFFLALYFMVYFSNGVPHVEYVISEMLTVTIFVMPIITMRLISEDRRQKVDQALFTAPVSLTGVVMGKFFAALAVFALGFAPSIIFELIVMSYISVNLFSFVYALIGILLLGSTLIAIGMFISTLTESAVVSAILTLVINILVLYMSSFAQMINIEWISKIIEKMAFINTFSSFGENLFSLPDIFYFVSITAAFIFLCVRALEKRRWA